MFTAQPPVKVALPNYDMSHGYSFVQPTESHVLVICAVFRIAALNCVISIVSKLIGSLPSLS